MVSKFITCKRGANKENVWEHGNIGQFWKGTRTPLGDPHLNPITKWLASEGERSRRSYGKNGTVNSLSMLYLIVTNYFITLAKGSCK